MAKLLKMEYPELATRLESSLYYGGLPLAAGFIRRALASFAGKVQA